MLSNLVKLVEFDYIQKALTLTRTVIKLPVDTFYKSHSC